jgi:hypothetical protein
MEMQTISEKETRLGGSVTEMDRGSSNAFWVQKTHFSYHSQLSFSCLTLGKTINFLELKPLYLKQGYAHSKGLLWRWTIIERVKSLARNSCSIKTGCPYCPQINLKKTYTLTYASGFLRLCVCSKYWGFS